MIRAKFTVTKKEKDPLSQKGFIIGMMAVYSGSPENESFFHYTPSASLNMQTVNEDVANQIEVGQECYLDITPIPMEKPAEAAAETTAETTALPSEPAAAEAQVVSAEAEAPAAAPEASEPAPDSAAEVPPTID